jgi:hypothetical protein
MEVKASESAWVDVVWFDQRLGLEVSGFERPDLRRHPVLPVVGFEIEVKTGLNAKYVKGSISNLNNLGAAMGVWVIGDNAITRLQTLGSYANQSPAAIQRELLRRAYRRAYAESQPRVRVVVMMETEAHEWLNRLERQCLVPYPISVA